MQIRSYTFRSTDDRAGLSEDEDSAADKIADMLFAKDDFRPPREWSMAKHGLSKAKGAQFSVMFGERFIRARAV